MCGIAGVCNFESAADPEILRRMTGAMRHRGPDDTGIHLDGPIGLAHARLSIIDVCGGAQPMSCRDGSLWITFNGEIFNYIELREELARKGHEFRTHSDTEVLLHLYLEEGEKCVERLNGQWAFAIWDARRRKLFLSRDRLGVRPLFYARTRRAFYFASEIKALLACSDVECAVDLEALDQIFTFWVTLPPKTAFRGISQLPPAHSMSLVNGQVQTYPHWRMEFAPQPAAGEKQVEQLTDEFLNLLLDATRIRLRADVPVGAYLSGGLDSTVTAALAHKLVGEKLRTFSVGFEDPEFDESRYQNEASAFLDTRHTGVQCTRADIASVFPDVVRHAEQPILRTAPAPLFLLSKLVRESGYKVVVTGEGADEILGGYDIFKEAKIRRFIAVNPQSAMRPLLLKRLYPYLNSIGRQPAPYLQRFFQPTPAGLASPFFSHLPRWDLTAKLKRFLAPEVYAEIRPGAALAKLETMLPDAYGSWPPFCQGQYLEAQYLLPGYILSSQGDRMAMAHSVEARYPFLDHRVVQFAAALPPRLKMNVLREKYLLKRAALGLIPEGIRNRPKQPYRAPDGSSFFLGARRDYVQEMLSPERIRRDALFDSKAVSALTRKFQSRIPTGTGDDMALVGILSTEILLDSFMRRRFQPDCAREVTA